MIAQEFKATEIKTANTYDDLMNLKSVLLFSIAQLEFIAQNDALIERHAGHLTSLYQQNINELELGVSKLKTSLPEKWNIIHGFKKKDCGYDNCLQLELLMAKSYKKLINDTDVNFSIRKKLQNQLNQVLYLFLQIKLIRATPHQVPNKRSELLF